MRHSVCISFLLAPTVALPAGEVLQPSRPTVVAASGTSLLSPDLHDLKLDDKNAADARVRSVRVSGQCFPEALQLEPLKRPPHPWIITLATLTSGVMRKGDVLLATVTARRIKSRHETGRRSSPTASKGIKTNRGPCPMTGAASDPSISTESAWMDACRCERASLSRKRDWSCHWQQGKPSPCSPREQKCLPQPA